MLSDAAYLLLYRPPPSEAAMSATRVSKAAPAMPSPLPPPAPYEVRQRASVGDTVLLTGYGAHGKPLLEIRLPRAKMCEALVRRMERWCRANDDQPDLQIVR